MRRKSGLVLGLNPCHSAGCYQNHAKGHANIIKDQIIELKGRNKGMRLRRVKSWVEAKNPTPPGGCPQPRLAKFRRSHPPRHRTAILVLVEGGTMREAGKRCAIKDSAALVLKRRIAADLIEFFVVDVIQRLLDGVRPGWESDLRTVRDRHVSLVVANAGEPTRKLQCA